MNSQDDLTLRIAWSAMKWIAWYVIVPVALASLLSGIIISVGTPWGLFKHYWVLLSLVLTLVASVVLLVHMQTVNYFAGIVLESPRAAISGLHGELVHAGGGLLVLLVVQVLNVYKPRGLTPYGWRRLQERRMASQP
jgi:hypothetical protein